MDRKTYLLHRVLRHLKHNWLKNICAQEAIEAPGSTKLEQEYRRWIADGGDYRLRFSYSLNQRSVVLDVGGFEGQWSSDLFARYGCRIIIFEPVSSFAKAIVKRFQHNKKIEVLQLGLAGISRTSSIGLLGDSSSVFHRSNTTQKIRLVDVAEWFGVRRIRRIDLMKINIEGGEYELLERLIETGLIKKVWNLQVQFHTNIEGAEVRMKKIRSGLAETHRCTYQYEFVWESWTRMPSRNTRKMEQSL